MGAHCVALTRFDCKRFRLLIRFRSLPLSMHKFYSFKLLRLSHANFIWVHIHKILIRLRADVGFLSAFKWRYLYSTRSFTAYFVSVLTVLALICGWSNAMLLLDLYAKWKRIGWNEFGLVEHYECVKKVDRCKFTWKKMLSDVANTSCDSI